MNKLEAIENLTVSPEVIPIHTFEEKKKDRVLNALVEK